jgi:predicted acyltransferase
MTTQSPGRLVSLDLFRGATMASMILVNNAGSWQHVYPPLLHKEWDGWTFTDTVFPFFLWIVGVAITLATARRIEQGQARGTLLGHTLRRAAILFALGLMLNFLWTFQLDGLRIPGVLQRIAICYLLATLIFLHSTWRTQIAWVVGLLSSYWLLMAFYPVPGCGAGSLTMDCNFARYIDGLVLDGHMYQRTKHWDPEGIVSTIPSLATTLLGVLAGHLLRLGMTAGERIRRFLFIGCCLTVAAFLIEFFMPINKLLWTVPYTLLMAGLSFAALAAWDAAALSPRLLRVLRPVEFIGMNAIALYLFSGIGGNLSGRAGIREALFGAFARFLDPYNASLAYAFCMVAAGMVVAWVMYRRRWFLKF